MKTRQKLELRGKRNIFARLSYSPWWMIKQKNSELISSPPPTPALRLASTQQYVECWLHDKGYRWRNIEN
jgi:hypothetical protein